MSIYTDGIKDLEYTSANQKRMWGSIYESILTILGSTGTIIPIGDTNHENSGRTTVTTVGEEASIFTYSEAISAFDKPPYPKGPARIPIVPFNGTDEEADTPDSTYWSRGDGTNDSAFSLGIWANMVDTSGSRDLLGKWDATSASALREWLFFINSSDELSILLYDESANVSTARSSDSAITMGSLRFFTVTYDGTGGASAGNTITLYDNGSVLASTATNNGSYVAMENLSSLPTLGTNILNIGPLGNFFGDEMVGGPLGPFFTQKELTADEILRLYQFGRVCLDV